MTYFDALVSVLRFYPNMTIKDAERTTLADFEVMLKAHQLRFVDKQLELHLSAWLNQQIKGTTRDGKPIYSNFQKFFNYEKLIREAGFENNTMQNRVDKGFLQQLSNINKEAD